MANIVGEEIPKYVIDQIKRRQITQGKGSSSNNQRTNQDLVVLNSRTSWIKLASGVSLEESKLKELGLSSTYKEGMELAKNHVLFGGTSTLSGPLDNQWLYPKSSNVGISGYERSSDFGIIPMPGLTDASIKTLNRGSIKKAKVRLKAYSREQFEILDVLYLRLGFTVLLEWGNTNYIDNNGNYQTVGGTLVEDNKRFFNESFTKDRSYLDLLSPLEYYRKKYQGNYDGFLGKVSNFSWEFNEDGSYDISLDIISLGDVIESLKSNLSIDSELGTYIDKFKQENKKEDDSSETSFLTPYDNNNIITSMLWLWKYANRDDTGETSDGISIAPGDGTRGFIGRILKPGERATELKVYRVYIVEKGNSKNEIWSTSDLPYVSDQELRDRVRVAKKALTINAVSNWSLVPQYAILNALAGNTLSDFEVKYKKRTALNAEKVFTTKVLPPKSIIRLNTPEKDHYIRFEYLLQYIVEKVIPKIKTNQESNPPLINIDRTRYDNIMYSLPNQISLDPRVCLVRNDKFFKSGTPDTPAKVLSELIPFRAVDYNSNASPNKAYVMNIYLNFNFVVDSLNSNTDERGDVGLFGFLTSICSGLNKALGGINNLEPILDETTNTLRIIDSSPIPGVTKDKGKYILDVFGYNGNTSNFIRKIDLKTAITPEYATMITVGATAGGYVKGTESTAFSKWNEGLIDRFKTDLTTADNKDEAELVVDEAEKAYVTQYLSKFINCYGFSVPNGWKKNGRVNIKFVDNIIGSNISVGTEYFKYLQNKNKAGGAIGFIPFKFNFDMDGLSGFKIYNKLHISTRFLPRNYGNTLDFIVTGITHDLKNNDWETSIQTQVIPKTTEISDLEISEEYIKQTIADVNSSGDQVSNCRELNLSPRSVPKNKINSTSTEIDAVNYIIDYLEGGYYHPTQAFDPILKIISPGFVIMANSGETIYGLDRVAGGWMNYPEGRKFWATIDKISGNGVFGGVNGRNSTKRTKDFGYAPKQPNSWGYNSFPGKKGIPPSPQLRIDASKMIKERYDRYFNSYFRNHPSGALIKSDGRGIFMFYRAVWNGSGFFQKYANNIKSKYDSGVTNIEDLICEDLTFRYNTKSSSFKKGVLYLRDAMVGF